MRGRALCIVVLVLAALAGCSRRSSSLYIDPGRKDADAAQPAAAPPGNAAAANTAH